MTESEEFVGRISLVSLLPQYLTRGHVNTNACQAMIMATDVLDTGDVHWGRCCSLVYGHGWQDIEWFLRGCIWDVLEGCGSFYGCFMSQNLASDTSKTRQGFKDIWYDLCNLRTRKL